MNIYLTGHYGRFHSLVQYATDLRGLGHTVTSPWTDRVEMRFDGTENPDENRVKIDSWARGRIEAIHQCDAFILLGEPTSVALLSSSRHVELGVALALGKPIFLLGEPENRFAALSSVYHPRSWETLLREFRGATLRAELIKAITNRGNHES